MTVCIAAVCKFPDNVYGIVGAADRKITAGDVQFEPERSKLYPLCRSVAVLYAGETDAQTEICSRTYMQTHNVAYMTTREAANCYGEQVAAYNRRNAERAALAPFGLTMERFLDQQATFSPAFSERLRQSIEQHRADIQAIVCGTDAEGAHLFVVDALGISHCYTGIAFAAIGDGQWHASSNLMFSRYTQESPTQEALLLIYLAKKRAEVAPGVGSDTDLFFIRHDLGLQPITGSILQALEEAAKSIEQSHASAIENAKQKIAESLIVGAPVNGPRIA